MFLRSLSTHPPSIGFSKIEHLPGLSTQPNLQAKVEQTGGMIRLLVEIRKADSVPHVTEVWKIKRKVKYTEIKVRSVAVEAKRKRERNTQFMVRDKPP